MTIDRYAQDILSVLQVIDAHSRATPQSITNVVPKSVVWRNWLVAGGAIGMLIAFLGNSLHFDALAKLTLLIVSVGCVVIGLALEIVYEVRTAKQPFVEHLNRLRELVPREGELLKQLQAFDLQALVSTQKRLQLESTKISARLAVIGGDNLKASLVGVGAAAYALLLYFEKVDFSTPSTSIIIFLGFAALLGLSIGAWYVRHGAVQWDYYSDLIGFVIDSKGEGRAGLS